MRTWVRRSLAGDDASSAVEYAIMVALVAAVIVLVVVVLGRQTGTSYCEVSEAIATVDSRTAASDDCS